jgi:hypothetical protein
MARDYHAILATSAPSERLFNIVLASNLVSKKQIRLSSENVRYMLCLRSWKILDNGHNIDNGKIIAVLLE